MLDRSEKNINLLLVAYCLVLAVSVLVSTVVYQQLSHKQSQQESAQHRSFGINP
jgi:Na+-transporting NADH:ubiquinone oxidoreductase subunit NqrC